MEEIKEDLLLYIPDRFIPHLEDGTINQPSLPKRDRDDFLTQQAKVNEEFEKILEQAEQNTVKAVRFLSKNVQEVFSESLLDAVLERMEMRGVRFIYI